MMRSIWQISMVWRIIPSSLKFSLLILPMKAVFLDTDRSGRLSHIFKHFDCSSVNQRRFYPDFPVSRSNFLSNIVISNDNGTLKKSDLNRFEMLLDDRVHDKE